MGSTYTYRYVYLDEHGVKREGEAKGDLATGFVEMPSVPPTSIPYGEGWPWPKREPRPGTVYRFLDDHTRDVSLVLAVDADGTRRGVEIDNKLWCVVVRPRDQYRNDAGASLSGPEDFETLLQAPEAWTTAPPPVSVQTLAAAIFRTDPDVAAFVGHVSEWAADANCCAPDYTGPCARCDAQEERHSRAMLQAWDRNENGWRTAALARAELMLWAMAKP